MDLLYVKARMFGRPFRGYGDGEAGGSMGDASEGRTGESTSNTPSIGTGEFTSGGWSAGVGSGTNPQTDTSGFGPGSTNANGTYSNGAGQKYNSDGSPMSWGQSNWDSIMSALSPQTGSLGYRLGLRAPGTTVEHMFDTETDAEKADRMGLVSRFIGTGANMIMSAAMPPGLMSGLRAYDAYSKGMPFKDALIAGLTDFGLGQVSGAVNKEVGKALGPDVAGALGTYNNVASLANLGGAGMPTVNPGGAVAGAIRSATGIPQLGTPTGGSMPQTGEPVSSISYSGWSSGSSGGGTSGGAATSPQAAPAPAAPANVVEDLFTNMRFNFNGAGAGQAIRNGAR